MKLDEAKSEIENSLRDSGRISAEFVHYLLVLVDDADALSEWIKTRGITVEGTAE